MPDSELINALSGGGLLSSIANPRVLNPNLVGDTYGKATDIANGLWRNRLAQSQQAVGENLLAATGQDGTIDTGKLAALNARDPTTALSAGASAQTGQALRSNDMGFNQAQMGAIGRSVGSVLTLPDAQQTPENYKQMLDYALANHGIERGRYNTALQALTAAGTDPGALRQFGTKLLVGTLAGPEMAQFVLPTKGPDVTSPQGDLQGTQRAPLLGSATPGAIIPRGAPVPQGPSQDTMATAPAGWVPDTRPGALPNSLMPVPRSYPPPPAGGGGNPFLGGAPSPAPGSADGNPAVEGQTEGLPGSKATPVGPADRARTAAVQQQKQVSLAPPQGQPDQLLAGNKVYTDAATAVPDQQKRLIAGESALQALDIAKTGPGTGMVAKAKAFFEAQSITAPPQGKMSDVDYRQVLVKNLLRFAQDKSKSTGTDLGLETQLHSNANADDMLPNANRHVLVQDLGILRRDMGQTATMPKGAAAIDHVKDFSASIDPRAFATKYMTKDEIGAMVERMSAKERQKFLNSLKVANDAGHVDLK